MDNAKQTNNWVEVSSQQHNSLLQELASSRGMRHSSFKTQQSVSKMWARQAGRQTRIKRCNPVSSSGRAWPRSRSGPNGGTPLCYGNTGCPSSDGSEPKGRSGGWRRKKGGGKGEGGEERTKTSTHSDQRAVLTDNRTGNNKLYLYSI